MIRLKGVVQAYKILTFTLCILICLFLSCTASAQSESNPELIWEIGVNDAPPDYTEKAFDEFDQHKPFDSHYYVDSDPCSNFSKQINDGDFTQIYIHYNLGEQEADMDLKLSLDTLYATHEAGPDKISDYNMKIKAKAPNGDWIEIGEYKFGSGDSIHPEEQSITIDTSYTDIGANTILLEDANPPWSDHWLIWDSLKLEAFIHPRPDLVPISVSFNPTSPTEGDSVRITANIRNDGQIEAKNVNVNFYYDEEGESHSIAIKNVPSISVSSSELISVDWITSNIVGDCIVTVVVDPENEIEESSEGNNILSGGIMITPVETMPPPNGDDPSWFKIIIALGAVGTFIVAIIVVLEFLKRKESKKNE